MEYFEAPKKIDTRKLKVFLAGGITDCPDWQAQAVTGLQDLSVAVLNPRRADFPIHDPSAAQEQIRWEFDALSSADVILFWFPAGSSVQPIALYELGRYLATGQRVSVGRDPGYLRAQDVDIQVGLARPGQIIHESLEATVTGARQLLGYL